MFLDKSEQGARAKALEEILLNKPASKNTQLKWQIEVIKYVPMVKYLSQRRRLLDRGKVR